jgi:hypothetical protein
VGGGGAGGLAFPLLQLGKVLLNNDDISVYFY